MRGRAIRVNSNPHKTANIWHLVCVCDNINGDSSIENADLNLLKEDLLLVVMFFKKRIKKNYF